MRDIGLLENRIKNIEYYTALSMLENETQSFEVQDENGLNRFKSGFVVDNFSGHRVGMLIIKIIEFLWICNLMNFDQNTL